jgi:Rrf2 family protein
MNSRLAVAVHILVLIARGEGRPVSSEEIARSVRTNPSLVRRLLVRLARAGLTVGIQGARGGALLARSPEDISLADVYRAVDGGEIFAAPGHPPHPGCLVGRNISPVLEIRLAAARDAVEMELRRTTIADAVWEVEAREARRER